MIVLWAQKEGQFIKKPDITSFYLHESYVHSKHDKNIQQTDKRWKGFQPEKRARQSTTLRIDELFNTVSLMIRLQPARCCTSWLIPALTYHRTASGASGACRRPRGWRGSTWTSCRTPCEPSQPPLLLGEPSSCMPHLWRPHSTAHTAIGHGSLLSRWQCSPGCSPPSGHSTHTWPTLSPLLACYCCFVCLDSLDWRLFVGRLLWFWGAVVGRGGGGYLLMVRYWCMFWGQRFETELVGCEPHLLAFSWH